MVTRTSIHGSVPVMPRAIGVMCTPANASENVRPITNAESSSVAVSGVVNQLCAAIVFSHGDQLSWTPFWRLGLEAEKFWRNSIQ